VLRNVAELVITPKGKPGRPSRAMTLEQGTAMLEEAKSSRLHAHVVVSLLTGIRTEEARALRWSHTSAGHSGRSPRTPGSGRTGRPGNCAIRSYPS
jgi:integrase